MAKCMIFNSSILTWKQLSLCYSVVLKLKRISSNFRHCFSLNQLLYLPK